MTKAFRVLAFIIAGLIVVQAAAVAWAVSGLATWVNDGNSFTKETMESDELPFTEVVGFIIHGMNGMMLIPLLALILMVIGIIAKHPGSTKFGVAVFLLVLLQVGLGLAHIPATTALHGANALILFGVVVMAGVKAKRPETVVTDPRTPVNA